MRVGGMAALEGEEELAVEGEDHQEEVEGMEGGEWGGWMM